MYLVGTLVWFASVAWQLSVKHLAEHAVKDVTFVCALEMESLDLANHEVNHEAEHVAQRMVEPVAKAVANHLADGWANPIPAGKMELVNALATEPAAVQMASVLIASVPFASAVVGHHMHGHAVPANRRLRSIYQTISVLIDCESSQYQPIIIGALGLIHVDDTTWTGHDGSCPFYHFLVDNRFHIFRLLIAHRKAISVFSRFSDNQRRIDHFENDVVRTCPEGRFGQKSNRQTWSWIVHSWYLIVHIN